jgi:hypothetical protein
MSARDDIRQALYDAIGWQEGLADAWSEGSAERREALDRIRRYKRILVRRYGTSMTALDVKLKDAKLKPALTTGEQPK